MADDNKTLAQFFALYPHHLETLVAGYPGHNPSNTAVWEQIFCFVFGEAPTDPEDLPKAVCTAPPKGSHDPRWETLLFSKGGLGFLKSMNEIIALQVSKG